MPLRLRPAVLVAALLAAAAVAAYTGYWFHVAGELGKGIDRWAAERRDAGWTIDLGRVEIGGFPGPIRVRLAGPMVTTPAGSTWQAEGLTARVAAFDLARIRIDAAGRHQLTAGGQALEGTAATAEALIHLHGDGRLDDASLTVGKLALILPGGDAMAVASLAATLDPLDVEAPRHDTATVAFILAAQGVDLQPIPGLVMDGRIGFVDIKGRVLGPVPVAGSGMERIAAWSAAGGAIEIDRVSLDWAPLGLEGEGTMALDGRLQPLAALTARVRGYGELMDRLSRAGMVEQGPAAAAKMLLSLMAKPDPRGRLALPVPVTLQDGFLNVGPARVGAVPPVPWPGTDTQAR